MNWLKYCQYFVTHCKYAGSSCSVELPCFVIGTASAALQIVDAEQVLVVGPAGARLESRALRQCLKAFDRVLVGVFGMDRLALQKMETFTFDRDDLG